MTSWKIVQTKDTRVWELKTVLELYSMEIHQKKAGPDYHRLKTMVMSSIELNVPIKNYEARNANNERNAVVGSGKPTQRAVF